MLRNIFLWLLPAAVISLLLIAKKGTNSTSLKYTEASKKTRMDEAWAYEFERTKDPNSNTVPRQRLEVARKIAYQKLAQKDPIPNIEWTELGPNNVGGRTRTILFDRTDATNNTVYAAGVAGGLWRTTNFQSNNTTWDKVNDFFDNLAITIVLQDPTNANRLLFGTGEGWFNGDAIRGAGVFEYFISTNTTNRLANTESNNFHYVQDMIFDLEGNLYAGTRDGLYRTSDNGANWEFVITGRICDLEIGADGDLYASRGIFSQGVLFKSDYAIHGEDIGSVSGWTAINPDESFQRIEIATAPSNAEVIYIMCQAGNGNDIGGVFRSDDGGDTWTSLSIPTMCDRGTETQITREGNSGQAWYDLILAVDPTNPMRVYAGGVDAARSDNGGMTWQQISSWTGGVPNEVGQQCFTNTTYVHADIHLMLFEPNSSTRLVIGSDGGIGHTANATANPPVFTVKNNNYNVTQFYACAIHPTGNNHLAGAQDNGTQQFNSSNAINATTEVTGGDGAFCHIDENQPQFQFTQFTGNNISRSTDGGQSFDYFLGQPDGLFINPSDYDSELNHLYLANAGGTYRRVLNAPTAVDVNDVVNIAELNGSQVTTILVDPNVTDRIWLGTSGTPKVVRVDDASTNNPIATAMSNGLNASGTLSSIDISALNPQHILVTLSNYGVNSIWLSTDEGNNWSSVEGNLPDMPVRWGIFDPTDPDQALVATEVGIWSTNDLDGVDTDWNPTNTNLANVRIDMLQTRATDNLVLAATHGRGMFATNYFSTPTVKFTDEQVTISETTYDDENFVRCNRRYTTIDIPVRISSLPPQNVSVVANVVAANTTLDDKDYDTVNSSLSLTFTPNGSLLQNMQLRILDDAINETTEQLQLELAISGNSNGVILSQDRNFLITVEDNDKDPLVGQEFIIVQEDWEGDIIGWFTDYTFDTENNVTDYNGWTTNNPASNNFCTNRGFTTRHLTIKDIFNSGPQIFCDYWPYGYSGRAIVYRNINGLNRTDIDVTFDWTCGGNATDYGSLVYSLDEGETWIEIETYRNQPQNIQNVNLTLPEAVENKQFRLGWCWKDDGDNNTNQSGFSFDDIKISTIVEPFIELNAGEQQSTYLKAGETAHFYSTDGNAIASVQQTSGADIGCITATVETGTGDRILNDDLNGNVTARTINITADNDAPYTLTLYYLPFELDEWEADNLNLNILKTEGTVANATFDNSIIIPNNAAEVIYTPNKTPIAYRADFTEFSSFALTDAAPQALSVEWLNFNAHEIESGNLLQWETRNEVDNDYFVVEHSIDGKTFNRIGVVNSKQQSTDYQYEFLHQKYNVGKNYYRLKQVERTGAYHFSNTLLLTNDSEQLIAYPNPVATQLIVPTSNKKSVIKVIDVTGKIHYQDESNSTKDTFINVKNWNNGVYFLQINTAGNIQTQAIIVQH